MMYREMYEEMREALIKANRRAEARQENLITVMRSRTQAFVELAAARKALAKAETERDNARTELRRVCAGAGFKVTDGAAS